MFTCGIFQQSILPKKLLMQVHILLCRLCLRWSLISALLLGIYRPWGHLRPNNPLCKALHFAPLLQGIFGQQSHEILDILCHHPSGYLLRHLYSILLCRASFLRLCFRYFQKILHTGMAIHRCPRDNQCCH